MNSSPPKKIIGNLRSGVQVMHHSRGLLRDTTPARVSNVAVRFSFNYEVTT